MKMVNTLMNYWGYLFGIGIIPLGWWTMRKVFKLIYPDEKLKKYLHIFPRSTGIQIVGNKPYLYITVINLSAFYNLIIKIENASIDGDNCKLDSTMNGNKELTIKKCSIIDEIRLEKKLDKDEKEFFLREPINREYKHLNIKVGISTSNKLLGNRVIGEKTLETFDILMDFPK